MKLVFVTTNNLEEYWLKTRRMIIASTKRSFGKYEGIDILKELMNGRMNLWVAEDSEDGVVRGLAITEIVQYPRMKVCKVLCCTGSKMMDWVHYLLEIEFWAKKNGCRSIEPVCRLGWTKTLKKMGYEPRHMLMEKVLQ